MMRSHASVLARPSVLVLACSFLTSCFFYAGYPKSWAPLETHSKLGCWQVVGTYGDEGVTSEKKPQSVSLSAILFNGGTGAWSPGSVPEGTSVKIAKLSEDTMEISVWKEGKQESARTLSRGKKEFSCSSKGVTISQGRAGHAGEGFEVGASWMHINLAVNKEGSLVVEGVESEVGAFIIIPVVGGSSAWAIFKRVEGADR